MSKALYKHRLTVGVTEKMNDLLEDLATSRTRKGKPVTKADLMREALRLFLDEQPDVRGSRKQITKSVEAKLEEMDEAFKIMFKQFQV